LSASQLSLRRGALGYRALVAELLVTPDWLVAHHADADVRVLDPRRPEDYAGGHVPGAVNAWSGFKDDERPLHVIGPEQAQREIRTLGISADTRVVVLGDGMLAGRVWWFLRLHGHADVRIADGGHAAYVTAGGPVTMEATAVRIGDFTARVDKTVVARAEDLLRDLGGRAQVLDVRSDGEWRGDNPYKHQRVGHVPGAIHLVWTDLLTEAEPKRFRSPDEIRAILAKHGITPSHRVVTVCEVGYRAAHSAFALRLAGFDDVRVYDASMREWDDREDLPLEPPPAS
jgi:thiosulfate/3-mercaptopyruvate sulfurtransferase